MTDSIKNRIEYLTQYLNRCCDEYYNQDLPSISDAEYDALFDELVSLETENGYCLPDSPTQRAGYEVISELKKVVHDIPLLSLAKTKSPVDVLKMAHTAQGCLGLKMDGLTVKLTYIDGKLDEACTRGDGAVGEIITHTARTFLDVPKTVPYKSKLCVTGEAYIDIPTFERINDGIDNDEDKYSTPRNLASGSVRQLDASVCAARGVRFMPFNVLIGIEDIESRSDKLECLREWGFSRLPSIAAGDNDTEESITGKLFSLKSFASKQGLPIDGIVFSYDNVAFAASLGRTSHHFRDGIAFKFGDPEQDTVLRKIDWNISRSGQLTPVAVFDACDIDGTTVERASLHNITFIEGLRLEIGDRIRVSKRNMIIPHVEENYCVAEHAEYSTAYPKKCPICAHNTQVMSTENNGKNVSVLYCVNPHCPGKHIKQFTHFVAKPAMNIDGLSEQTLVKLMTAGLISELADIYNLSEHENVITSLEGFGRKSYDNLVSSVERTRHCKMSNFLVALNIPLIGASAARDLERVFAGDILAFIAAARGDYDFSSVENFGEITGNTIHGWFQNEENIQTVMSLLPHLDFVHTAQATKQNSVFAGKICVITGKIEGYGRDELSNILRSFGATVTGSVSKKTDIVIAGEDAGSKLEKAKQFGIRIMNHEELNQHLRNAQ